MKATILDTYTGETRTIKGLSVVELREGEWSHDRLRGTLFGNAINERQQLPERHRFVVVSLTEGDPTNYGYPTALVALAGLYCEMQAKVEGRTVTDPPSEDGA